MAQAATLPKGKRHSIAYNAIRNITSPEDSANGRKVYVGHVPITSIVALPTDENVRDYLLEAEGKLRKRPTGVHRAIKETLINHPDNFSVLNGGITVVANEIEVEEKEKVLYLKNPSIINGAQTQGIIREVLKDYEFDEVVHIKCEIIVTVDDDLIADISIARNYQNDVMPISIVGRRGQLDELEESFKSALPDLKLRKSETHLTSGEYVDTEKLIQVITALIPAELWQNLGEDESPNKVFTYSQKSKCLKHYQDMYVKATDNQASGHEEASALYEFFLDVAPQAYELYEKWKEHPQFKGTRIAQIQRSERGEILDVPDGIIFPILAALSEFMRKTKNGWKLSTPSSFTDKEIITQAASFYKEMAKSNPQTMGKSRACYSALLNITSLHKRLSALR